MDDDGLIEDLFNSGPDVGFANGPEFAILDNYTIYNGSSSVTEEVLLELQNGACNPAELLCLLDSLLISLYNLWMLIAF